LPLRWLPLAASSIQQCASLPPTLATIPVGSCAVSTCDSGALPHRCSRRTRGARSRSLRDHTSPAFSFSVPQTGTSRPPMVWLGHPRLELCAPSSPGTDWRARRSQVGRMPRCCPGWSTVVPIPARHHAAETITKSARAYALLFSSSHDGDNAPVCAKCRCPATRARSSEAGTILWGAVIRARVAGMSCRCMLAVRTLKGGLRLVVH